MSIKLSKPLRMGLIGGGVVLGMAIFPIAAVAQVKGKVAGASVVESSGNTAIAVGEGNTVINSTGSVGSDVEMEGVAIINEEVFIDGEKIPKGKTRHKAKKSGKSYRINWGKNGNVSVEEN